MLTDVRPPVAVRTAWRARAVRTVGAGVVAATLVSCGGTVEERRDPAAPEPAAEEAPAPEEPAVGEPAAQDPAGQDPVVTSTWSFEGFDVVSAVPDDPVGLVFVFHGSYGSVDHVTRPDGAQVVDELITRGYGFVATESTQRTDEKRWDVTDPSPATNPDLARLERLRAEIVATTGATDTTPLFGVGMSNGSRFAGLWGEVWADAGQPVQALALVMGPITRPVVERGGLHVPALFVAAEHDTLALPERIVADHDATAARGVRTELIVAEEQALTAEAFLDVPGVDPAGADEIVAALVATGAWDTAGTRLVSVEEAIARVGSVELPASLRSVRPEVQDRCAVLLAVHHMRGDLAVPVADFFDASLD